MQPPIDYWRIFAAVTAGIVVGNIILAVFWTAVGTMALGTMLDGLHVNLGSTPSSSVTSGDEYQDAQASERRAEAS